RSAGVVGFWPAHDWCRAPHDRPSATLSRRALLDEEGKVRCFPPLVEEGWPAAPGWWVLPAHDWCCAPQDHPSATLSRRALLDEEGKVRCISPPRGGGVARSTGVVGFAGA